MKRLLLRSCATLIFAISAHSVLAAPVLYGIGGVNQRSGDTLYTIDTNSGVATAVASLNGNFRALAFDPTTGRAYASIGERDSSGSIAAFSGGLYEVDLNTGATIYIGGTEFYSELEFDSAGNLYAYGNRRNGSSSYHWFSIDTSNGAATLLNSTALSSSQHALFGLSYSSLNDTFYLHQQWFNGAGGNGLSTINSANGTATAVVNSPYVTFMPDLAIDDSGNFFTTDRNFGTGGVGLYSLNTNSGVSTLIGRSGVFLNSIAFSGSPTPPAAVSEPAPGALLGIGAIASLVALRRRQRPRLG